MTNTLALEEKLVQRAKDGDTAAFEQLIEIYSPALFGIVMRMAQDEQQAELVLQETFWRTWRALGRYQSNRPFLPYLASIAANYLRDMWRKDKRLLDWNDDLVQAKQISDQPEVLLEQKQAIQDLEEIVAHLPDNYRMVIALRYDAEFSYEQIAETLSIPVNTVRTYIRRAKQVIREKMGEREWIG